MKILITGTPGVGKSTLAKQISNEFNIESIDISYYIKTRGLYLEYDSILNTLIFEEDVVTNHLNTYITKIESFIIESHTPIIARNIKFDFIFHIKCDTKILVERLSQRKYCENKILKNIECEIFDVIGKELIENFKDESIIINEEIG